MPRASVYRLQYKTLILNAAAPCPCTTLSRTPHHGPQGLHLGLLPHSPPLVAPSWAWLASFWALLLAMGAHSGPSCGNLATSWAHHGPSFPQLGPSLARLTTSNLYVPTLQIFVFPRYIFGFPRYEDSPPCAPASAPPHAPQ